MLWLFDICSLAIREADARTAEYYRVVSAVVISKSVSAPNTVMITDIPVQIRKYKSLLDDGIIPQEESEKKELLNG